LQDCSKQLPITEAELELILQTNENLPTDEMELVVRDLIVMGVRERDYIDIYPAFSPTIKYPCFDDIQKYLISRDDITQISNPFASPNDIRSVTGKLKCIGTLEAHDTIVRNQTLMKERKRISEEIVRILKEHPARTVNRFFLEELAESIRDIAEQPK
jgi:hypothetical protein